MIISATTWLRLASGNRGSTGGAFGNVGAAGYNWAASVTSGNGYNLAFDSGNVYPRNNNTRANGFPVRCISAFTIELCIIRSSSDPTTISATTLSGLASGYRSSGSGTIGGVGVEGNSWAASATSTNGYRLNFTSSNVNPQNTTNRANGAPVRCISAFTDKLNFCPEFMAGRKASYEA